MTLNEEVRILKEQVMALQSKLSDLSKNLEDKNPTPYSKVGATRSNSQNRPVEPGSGLGGTQGGSLPWNDSELKIPAYGAQPDAPTKGYNKHGHSRYAGGALDIHTVELVEYETDENDNIIDEDGNILNKHCQQYWVNTPKIKTVEKKTEDGQSEFVPKIGNLDIEFDAVTQKWVAGGKYIDVENTYLIRKDPDTGEIMKAEDGETEMKSVLLDTEDDSKSSVVWDDDSSVWRFYAVFAEDPSQE